MMEPDAQRKVTVEAFLCDPKHLAVDDGSALDHPTVKPELYRLLAVQQRLLPVEPAHSRGGHTARAVGGTS
jgi:hypothetical protein